MQHTKPVENVDSPAVPPKTDTGPHNSPAKEEVQNTVQDSREKLSASADNDSLSAEQDPVRVGGVSP